MSQRELQTTRRLYRELDSDELDEAYFTVNIPTVEVQLQHAGVRLAAMLNAMFAPPPASRPATAPPADGQATSPAATEP